MDEPIKSGEKQPETDQISVQTGGKESAPSSIEAPSITESALESSGEHKEVEMPEEVKEAGVKKVRHVLEEPAGVQLDDKGSKGPVYGNLPTETTEIEKGLKQSTSDSISWRSMLAEKVRALKKNLLGQEPQGAN